MILDAGLAMPPPGSPEPVRLRDPSEAGGFTKFSLFFLMRYKEKIILPVYGFIADK